MTKRTRSDNNGSYYEEVKNDKERPPNDNNAIKRELQIITMVPIKVCHTVTWGVQPTNRGQG